MKDQKENIKEPFRPEATPPPPQIIDPSKPGENKHPHKAEPKDQQQPQEKSDESKKKLPGQSDTEIDDETTI